jgi:hypothetical protein
MRTGGPRTQPLGPQVFFHRGHSAATPCPALTAVSPLRFISGGSVPRTCGPEVRAPSPCLRPACLLSPRPLSSSTGSGSDSSSSSPFYLKRLCAGDMRTGGPRTQPLGPHVFFHRGHSAGTPGLALTAVSPLRFISGGSVPGTCGPEVRAPRNPLSAAQNSCHVGFCKSPRTLRIWCSGS